MARTPAYREVYQELKKRIKQGIYAKGSMLPTEPELENEFHVSRTTIRRATSLLAMEGYLRIVQGKGSEILTPQSTQNLNSVTSTTETLIARGYNVTTHNMNITLVKAPPEVAEKLKLAKDEMVYLVERVQYIEGTPIAIMNNYIRREVAPGIERYCGQFVSLYSFLESQYGVVFKEATEYLSAVAADFMESIVLQIPVGTPLLCSKRVTSGYGQMIECSVVKLLADRYEYCIYMSGR